MKSFWTILLWPGVRTDTRPSARSAGADAQGKAAAVGLPTRMTNNAGATKAQIAPFSNVSQQLQRKIRKILDETQPFN